MNKIILTAAAVLLASGTAFASERYGDAAPAVQASAAVITSATPQKLLRSGDATKAAVVVNVPAPNFSSEAAFGTTGTNSIGSSPRILYGSN
jgi:hypothetical protein